MFTGLVEEIGIVRSLQGTGHGLRISINCQQILSDLKIDQSVNVNGACLTVVQTGHGFFDADVVHETVAMTTLKFLKTGAAVNLERALQLNARLGGHLVSGHVDGIGQIVEFQKSAYDGRLSVELPSELAAFIIPKGSVALDGISLTVAKITGTHLTTAIIPHSLENTTLKHRHIGDWLNIEVDLIGKYVFRRLEKSAGTTQITEKWLQELGFMST
ncbi:riboflavin synthase [candidate division KSB1 bacterium]|nr:riboflavin synthase [candidate division KSB1 bacterium]